MSTINVTGRDYHAGKMTLLEIKRALRKARRELRLHQNQDSTSRDHMLRDKITAYENRLSIAEQGNMYRWVGMFSKKQIAEEII